jgi:hypothetical protein
MWVIVIEKIDFKQMAPSDAKKRKTKMQKIYNRAKKIFKQQLKLKS